MTLGQRIWKLAVRVGVLLALAAGVLVSAAMSPARAGFYTGNELLAKCTADVSNPNLSICFGYVEAVADSLDWTGWVGANGTDSCVPAGVTTGQLKDVLIKALNDDPANRNVDAYLLSEVAFKNAWHCKYPAPKKK